MNNLGKLLDRKTALIGRLSKIKNVLDSKSTYITIGSGLDLDCNEPVFSDIMKVLFIHQEECSEELRDIERKINAINELLGGM